MKYLSVEQQSRYLRQGTFSQKTDPLKNVAFLVDRCQISANLFAFLMQNNEF